MAAHRWIVCVAALAFVACASRVEPRLDAGLAAGWQDGPKVGGNLGLGKYETTFAPPPFAGPVPPLSSDAASPPAVPPSPAVVMDGSAGQDLCPGGNCALPGATTLGPTAAPASAPAGSGGGFPWLPVLLTAGVVGGLAFVARKGSVK